ncbi:hypothetical protein N9A94_07925 [Akkermansiaceae bacterium]|nr:hypothetical protein [Akkermansiaceae bacterium]MDA7888375.1 hypothetical protein [Akkermansiaceae bacterium]MDB4537892.1 hypothetical protein [Akkermansiaceae bacterium]
MKNILTLLLVFLGSQMGSAQLNVHLNIERDQYLAHEPVYAVVTITNRSGKTLELVSEQKGAIAHSWLDFSMRTSGGRPLPKLTNSVFQKAKIPAGQAVKRRVNLNQLFGVSRVNAYSVTASVRQSGTESMAYSSNSAHFSVNGGIEVYRQAFGVPNSRASKREYRVLTFNDGRRTSIYASVMNTVSGRSLSTFRVSEALLFKRPQCAPDGKNRLHILYLANPTIFVHAIVNQDGGMEKPSYIKVGASGDPRLVAFANGEVAVSGGIPYDPAKEAEARSKVRKATDRPQGATRGR